MTLNEAIEERREQMRQLQLEVEQLEAAAAIIGGQLAGNSKVSKSVKPPPAAREKPVRAETTAKQSKRDETTYKRCGHPRTRENSYIPTKNGVEGSWSCKTCQAGAYQRRKNAAAKASPPKVKKADGPSPASTVAFKPVAVTVPAPLALIGGKPCPMIDFETGNRCVLTLPHDKPHKDNKGRNFYNGVNVNEMGGSTRAAGRA